MEALQVCETDFRWRAVGSLRRHSVSPLGLRRAQTIAWADWSDLLHNRNGRNHQDLPLRLNGRVIERQP
jgi:hypothetical protein